MLSGAPHRGPDGDDAWLHGGVALAHQYFAVDAGARRPHFPAIDEAGRIAVTFDGRLDNCDDLAERLNVAGERIESVLLAAYSRWGTECAQHLAGDFAVVFWDDERRQLFFARDRLGVRDLCYSVTPDRVLVASEVDHILGHPAFRSPSPDERKVAMTLANCWVDHEHSFIDGIRFCPPGACGTVDRNGAVRITRYWQADLHRRLTYRDDRQYAEHFGELFRRALARRLPNNGRVGVSLSGGPDSAAVAATSASLVPRDRLRSYSYVFERFPTCDERAFIDRIVSHLDLDATYLAGDDHGPLIQQGDRIVYPGFGTQDPYIGLVRTIYRAASEDGCRVLVTGHSADHLFSGGDFWAGEMAASGRLMTLAVTVLRHRENLTLGYPFRSNPIAQVLPMRLRRALAGRATRGVQPWIAGGFARTTDLDSALALEAGRWDTRLDGRPRRLQHLINAAESQGMSAARRHFNGLGIEVVDPFFDTDLVEMALAVPADQLGRPHLSKWMLRQSLRGKVPERCRLRAGKTSLFELFADALAVRARSFVDELLTSPQVVERGWIDPAWLATELQRSPAEWTLSGLPLWQCVTLEMWLRECWP